MSGFKKVDRMMLKKAKIDDAGNDLQFWQSQTPEFRLETLENIREEYNRWKYFESTVFLSSIITINNETVGVLPWKLSI